MARTSKRGRAPRATRCPRCEGSGTVPLSPQLASVIDYIAAHGPQSTRPLAHALDIEWTAARQRVSRLVQLDVVERRGLDTQGGYEYGLRE